MWNGGTWSTYAEQAFIDGLGTHYEGHSHPHSPSRLQLLLGYKKGLALRKEWGILDRASIEAHLNLRIAEESQKEPK